MKILVCDRCKKKFNNTINPMQDEMLPTYLVRRRNLYGWEDVDLCKDCEEKLNEFLVGDSDEHTSK